MEPDTTIIAGASSWRGTFTQCGGIPRMMAGSLVVAGEQVGQQQQADSLVVVGAQQDQGGGVLSPCLLQQHKATNHEAALFCTRRSGRSLKTRQGGAKG